MRAVVARSGIFFGALLVCLAVLGTPACDTTTSPRTGYGAGYGAGYGPPIVGGGIATVRRGHVMDAAPASDAARGDAAGSDADAIPDAGSDDAADDASADGDSDAGSDAGELACAPPASHVCPSPPPSFANDILPIVVQRCDGCHDPNAPSGPWPFQGYDDVAGWATLIQPDLMDCTMPPPDSGVTLPAAERFLILSWIDCGIPNN